jgi:DNA-binding CsgD family transcriptional regulator
LGKSTDPAVGSTARLAGRNGEIWQRYLQGQTQERIAQEYGLSREYVNQIIRKVRDSIPEQTRQEIIAREVDFLDKLRDEVTEMFNAPMPPAFDRDGNPLVDPDTGKVVRDTAPRMNILGGLVKLIERHAKMLGTDAATKLDATITADEDTAAKALAAQAAARLAGEAIAPRETS